MNFSDWDLSSSEPCKRFEDLLFRDTTASAVIVQLLKETDDDFLR